MYNETNTSHTIYVGVHQTMHEIWDEHKKIVTRKTSKSE